MQTRIVAVVAVRIGYDGQRGRARAGAFPELARLRKTAESRLT
jgi:hypothetical protein